MEWLASNGIEGDVLCDVMHSCVSRVTIGLGLNLFKLLLSDSIIPSVGYVPILNKPVTSLLDNVSYCCVMHSVLFL